MRGDTKIFLAARNVGDSNHEGEVWDGPAADVLKDLIRWIGETTIARRIDIAIGRDFESISNRILGTRATNKINEELVADEIAAMLARVENEEPDPEDDYQG